MDTNSPVAARAGRREWVGLGVLALACLLYAMDLTVRHLAVPHLSADLQPSSAQLLWIVDIYGFLVAGSLITMGTLGDRIGRRRLLLIGAAAFGAASVLAAFSTSAETLIASRALLDAAREAFVQGLHLTALIGAVVMVGAAVLAVVLLRGTRPGSGPEAEDRTESVAGAADAPAPELARAA